MLKFIKPLLKLKKSYLIALILVFIFLAWVTFGRGSDKRETLVLTEVKRQDIRETVSTSGVLTGTRQATLKFKSGGKLSYLTVKPGDTVFAGQVIAGLDSQSQSITLQQAENTLRDKQANVEMVLDNVKDHDSDETFTQKQQRTAAEVARDNAFDAVKAAKTSLADSTLISPIAGLVVKADFFPGQTVSASDTIAEIIDFSQIIFEADVDESDITKITVDQKTEVTLNAYGEKIFLGKISEIGSETKTTSNGATVVTVKIVLDDQTLKPIAGLNGQVTIITGEKTNVLAIPQESLRDDNSVLKQTGQGLTKIQVVPGLRSDIAVEIESGISEGTKIIKNPPANFTRNQNPLNGIFRFMGPRRN